MKTHEELMQMKAAANTAMENAKALRAKTSEASREQQEAETKATEAYKAFTDAVSQIYFTHS